MKPKPRRLRSRESYSIPESLDSTQTTEKNDEYSEVVLNQSDEGSKRKYSSRLDFVDENSKYSLFDDDLSIIVRESNPNELAVEPAKKDVNSKNTLNTTENIIDIKDILATGKGNNLLANGMPNFSDRIRK